MNFKESIIKEMERKAKILEQEPIRIGEIARYINESFRETVKIMEINNPLKLNWLKDNEYAIILFDVNQPHKPVPVIVEFDEDNKIKQVKPFNDTAKERLEKISSAKNLGRIKKGGVS